MIKLCYQEYETKVTLDAHREFLKRQGNSLGYYIGKALLALYNAPKGASVLERMQYVKEAVPFDVALDIFDVITEKRVTKEELEDAMWRVDWIPTEREGDIAEPWTYVLTNFATTYTEIYGEITVKKK